MNLELLKPVETGSGMMKPFLRIIDKGNKLQFNKAARSMLEVDQGGAIQVARDADSGNYYIISQPDKRAACLYHVTKNGILLDLLLPSKLLAYAGGDKRLYISPVPAQADGRKAYLIQKNGKA